MTNQKSDKPLVRKLSVGCLFAFLLFHLLPWKQYQANLHNPVFSIVDFLLIGLFAALSLSAHKDADDPNKDWLRVAMVVVAILLCLWAGGWAAGYNERVGL